jgi:hypothetical protein
MRHWLAEGMAVRATAEAKTKAGERAGGTGGNRRLTGALGAVLLVLLAAEGLTLLAVRQLLSFHVFIGVLVVPVILAKLASTGYRFVRYYTGNAAYRREGPPQILLRLTAPLLVLATVVLFASGIALLVVGRDKGGWLLSIHAASFAVWAGAMTIHVLGHALRLPRLVAADWKPRERLAGAGLRRALVAGALLVGLVAATAMVPLAHGWDHGHHFHDGQRLEAR